MPLSLSALFARYRRWGWPLLLGIIGPWGIFLKASSELQEGEGFYGDVAALRWIHAHATPVLDTLNLLLSRLGGPIPMVGVTICMLGVLWWRGQHHNARFLGAATVGAAALNLLAKWILGRPRPAFWVSLAPEASSSFPSGHAMGSAALALALGVLLAQWRGRWLAWVVGSLFAVSVGISRVYLGVHYPSDVLAGWLATMGWVTSVYLVWRPRRPA